MSYLEVYANEIVPRIREIDLWLKSGEDISTETASGLLGITPAEVKRLHGDGDITPRSFLSLMLHGPGEVCGLYRRELELGSPVTYTADDISYIYGIDIALVRSAFDKLNAAAVTEYMLAEVFAEIQA